MAHKGAFELEGAKIVPSRWRQNANGACALCKMRGPMPQRTGNLDGEVASKAEGVAETMEVNEGPPKSVETLITAM